MLPFQKTSLYKQSLEVLHEVIQAFERRNNPTIKKRIEEEAFTVSTHLAKAFSRPDAGDMESRLQKSEESTFGIMALLDLAEKNGEIDPQQKKDLISKLGSFQQNLHSFGKQRKKILILTGAVGQGHMSAAKALAEAFEYLHGYDYSVEIVDIMELLNSAFNAVSKTYYESSVKYAPAAFKFIYESTNTNDAQLIKLLNQVNYPFVISKVKKFFEEKNPDVLISTFPSWNYLVAEIWKKYRKDAKFISIITDSIVIHNSWLIADTDYHIVANKDTQEVLIEQGIPPEKIKILGFPVKLNFLEAVKKREFLKKLALDPDKFTILFLPTSQNQRKTQKMMKEFAEMEEANIIVITGHETRTRTKLEKMAKKTHVKIFGWAEKMPEFIQAADLVVTKAGGAIVMECIAAKKPMIITSIIPGQEQGNAELIKRYRLGIISDSKNEGIAEEINEIRKKYKSFEQNLINISKPDAAIDIARFVIQLLE